MSTDSINTQAVSDMFRFIEKGKGKVQALTRGVLLEIGYRLVARSAIGDPSTWRPPYWPKGYIPGHFINNWQVGIDTIPVGEIRGSDPTGAASLERLSRLGRWTVGHVYTFVNNVPYAALLETGTHSPQVPPGGMVGLTRAEYPDIVREVEARMSGSNFEKAP